jgi:hypothetical protein
MLQAELSDLRERMIVETESFLSDEMERPSQRLFLPPRRPPRIWAHSLKPWPFDRANLGGSIQPAC